MKVYKLFNNKYIYIEVNSAKMHLECQTSEEQIVTFQDFLTDLISCLDQSRRPQYYVPEEREIVRLKNNLISNSFIIYGPSGSGKTSSILWAASFDPDVVVLVINCDIDTTEKQFIKTLYDGVKKHAKSTNQQFLEKDNTALVFQNMKFDLLNDHIKSSGKKFVFAIKKCEKIAEMKKPTLFYNLIEWINGPMKPYLGLAFLSRAFHFTDRLEKRVKSRMTAKSITLIRPQGEKIIRIYLKRFQILKNAYLIQIKAQKIGHRKKTPFLETQLKWVEKIMRTIVDDKGFKLFVEQRMNGINNQFLSCMKVAFMKSLSYSHFESMDQSQFNKAFVQMLKDASLHIAPNYYQNLVKQCPLYSILVLALICYMGINDRLPYKMSSVFDIYKQIVLTNQKLTPIVSGGSSKIFFQRALQKLIDMRIIMMDGEDDDNGGIGRRVELRGEREIKLSIPPEDLQQVIADMSDVPNAIKDILERG